MNTVLVFGAPRSGTTYLVHCLRHLKSTACKSGTLVPTIVPHLAGSRPNDTHLNQALRESLFRSFDAYLNSEYHSRFEAMEYWWTAPRQVDRLSHVLRKGSRPRPKQFVYKEPFFALAPELVAAGLPDAKILYIYRDGRDVANSLVDSYDVLTDEKLTDLRSTEARLGRRHEDRYVPWWVANGREADFLNSSPYVRSIWMWTFMVQRCHQYFQDQDDGQVLQLQYEAFMQHPQDHGRRILDHLGVSETQGFRKHLDRAQTSSIGKHEQRSSSELKAAHRVASSMLTTLGYD